MIDAIRNATRAFTLAALAVGLLTLLPAGPTAQAQDELPRVGDIRDISVHLRTLDLFDDVHFDVYVYNKSTVEMRDVQVRLTADPPVGITAVSLHEYAPPDDFDASSGIWAIDELAAEGAGRAAQLLIQPDRSSTAQYVTIRAEIIGSSPAEGAAHLDNSQAVTWAYTPASAGERKVLFPNAELAVAVRNPLPEPGENADFTVSVGDPSPRTDSKNKRYDQAGVVVKVELSEGLAFAGAPSRPSGTSFTETSPTVGVWRLGRGGWEPGTLRIPVRLTTEAGAAPPLNRRCLTAQIVDSVPPPELEERQEQIEAHTVCLGRKTYVLSDGEAIVSLQRCLPPRRPICPSDFSTLLGVRVNDAHNDFVYYLPEDLIILVDPKPLANPLTFGGTTWLWSTGHVIPTLEDDDRFPGVRVIRGVPVPNIAESRKFRISDVTPTQRPGKIAIIDRYLNNSLEIEFYEALNPDKSDKLTDAIDDSWNDFDYPHLVVFSEPGLYKVNMGIEFILKAGNTMFSESATLTFVVGTAGELQVHDAGLHGTLPRGQQAYTLRAENNQPGTVEQVEVALSGVPRGAKAEVSEDGGSYERGDCGVNGLCSGIWKIGDLESRDYRYNSGRSDGPTLTLLVGGSPDPITATITSEQTQTVTAGGETYTLEFIDIDDSNSKDVSVAVGTGRGEPDPEAPQDVRVERLGATALVRWAPVEKVSQWPVAYYEVERNRQLLDVRPTDPLYLDLQASGNPVYRVRAVSEAGVRGPWKISARGLLPPSAPRDLAASLITDSDVQLTWAAHPDEAVNSYTVQAADHVGGPWSTVARLSGDATHWLHTNLPASGATKHYRIRAHNRTQPGAWSEEVAVTLATPPDDAPAPTGLRAQRYTTNQGNHGIQVWFTERFTCDPNQPTDREAEGYVGCRTVIEFREVGGGAWLFGSEDFGEYGIVPWDPDDRYFTQGDGRSYAVRLDTAYDIRVCKFEEKKLEEKLRGGAADGTWCVGEPTGRVRVPAGE